MTRMKLERRRPSRAAARLAAGALVIGGTGSVFGCLDRPLAENKPRTTETIIERLTQSAVDKIDLLLAIDNSRSMADKQKILALAVPDLVEGLVNPRCVDPTGMKPPVTVMTPTTDCPSGYQRDFNPVLDIHIGIVTSSLGGHGADVCPTSQSASNDDHGHLIYRSDTSAGSTPIPTYQNKGFLAWDPTHKLMPPGESVIDEGGKGLVPTLRDMVIGVGQVGCGYESQLEGWYRFLVDPEPYGSIAVKNNAITVTGVDDTVISQRKDFLRPSSLLAIILLSDENDCSIREEGQYWFVGQQKSGAGDYRMPLARHECATDPNDKCCRSCISPQTGCPPDPNCAKNPDGTYKSLSAEDDADNLRCWDTKRRFGIDFLYPIDRYAKALTSTKIQKRDGTLVDNPIFSDLNKDDADANIRDPGLVFFAGIVGVPWQDIARQNAQGQPDLEKGLDKDGNPVGGFKTAEELRAKNGMYTSTWDILIGNPDDPKTKPGDPHMIESVDPRSGSNPIDGTTIAPVTAMNDTDKINGHEWTPPNKTDLQYACIFPLTAQVDCTTVGDAPCDCKDPNNNSPLCSGPDGARTTQVNAKAYPGVRELELIKELGSQGIVGSVCPKQLDRSNDADFGYRPAIGAIIDRLKTVLGGQCLPRSLKPDANGQVSCLILEARNSKGTKDCNYAARRPVQEAHKAAAEAALQDPSAKALGWDTVCEIEQVTGPQLEACRSIIDPNPVRTSDGKDVDGWCYIDATTVPPTGDPKIVDKCPRNDKRLIRFVGKGEAQLDATLFITCSGEGS